MNKITTEAVGDVRALVINQSRFILPPEVFGNDVACDESYEVADRMTDEQTEVFLKGKDIISDEYLEALVNTIGLKTLYTSDGVVEDITDYLMQHKEDCSQLWNYLLDGVNS